MGSHPGPRQMPAPPPPSSSSTRLIIGAIASVVVVALAILAIVLLADRMPEGTSGAPESTTMTSGVPTEDLPAGGVLDGVGESTAPPADPADQQRLRELIPLDFSDVSCAATGRRADDGSSAALDCGASISRGANGSQFYLYSDEGALDEAFTTYVEDRELTELESDATCGELRGWFDYTLSGSAVGRVACYVDGDGSATVAWTSTEYHVLAVAASGSGDDEGLNELFTWWQDRGRIAPS